MSYLGKENLPTKGYARIYVQKEEDIETVNQILDKMDEYEAGYKNKDLVALWEGKHKARLVYNGKYDELDMNKVKSICADEGIFILIFSTGCYASEPYSMIDWSYK